MTEKLTFKVGTRKSQLALTQTDTIINKLKNLRPDLTFELVKVSTTGDKILDSALAKIGVKDMFSRELEVSLRNGAVDFVVHSLKDLPTRLPDNLVIGCVNKRDSPFDAVVMHPMHDGKKLAEMPDGSVIGTSSVRRSAQLQARHPKLIFQSIRGNLNTRFRKLEEDGQYDAIILAEAGLSRMGWQHRISQVLTKEDCMYAVSQGAIAVECRHDDQATLNLLSLIQDQDSAVSCIAERSFLKHLEGGCSVPVSVCSTLTDTEIELVGSIFSLDGKDIVVDTVTKTFPVPTEIKSNKTSVSNGLEFACIVPSNVPLDLCKTAEQCGKELAQRLLQTEGAEILRTAKAQTAKAVIEEAERKAREVAAAAQTQAKA